MKFLAKIHIFSENFMFLCPAKKKYSAKKKSPVSKNKKLQKKNLYHCAMQSVCGVFFNFIDFLIGTAAKYTL